MIYKLLDNVNWITSIVSVIVAILAYVAARINTKKQLKQNIFPDIVLCHKRVDIPIDKLNSINSKCPEISIPMANIGKSSAKNFTYRFNIEFNNLKEITNDISKIIPNISFDFNLNKKILSIKENNNNDKKEIKFKTTKVKLISFILPIQDAKNAEKFKIYSDYVDLLRILLTFNPGLDYKKLPILHIHLSYEDIDDDEINKSYKLTPKIKERRDHKIKLLFVVNKKNDSPKKS